MRARIVDQNVRGYSGFYVSMKRLGVEADSNFPKTQTLNSQLHEGNLTLNPKPNFMKGTCATVRAVKAELGFWKAVIIIGNT